MLKRIECLALMIAAVLLISAGCQGPSRKTSDRSLPKSDWGLWKYDMGTKGVTYRGLTQHTFTQSGEDFDPCISNDGKWIFFASTRHSRNPDIYMKKINEKVIVKKTKDPGADIQPAVSPDGNLLAFASNRNGNWDIWVTEVKKHVNPRQITRDGRNSIQPCWSRDGKKLLFVTYNPVGCQWEIWEKDFETEELKNLGPGQFAKYSRPEGKYVVFQKPRNRDVPWYSIWSMNTKGDQLTEIIQSSKWAAITPDWSPDGNKIAFATIHKSFTSKAEDRKYEGDDIWMVKTDGTSLVRLTVDPSPDWNPVWSPDGRIFFISKRNGFQNIWSIRPLPLDKPETEKIGSVDEIVSKQEDD